MKLSQLEKAEDFEVKEWLIKKLDLSPFQRNKLISDEIIRFAPFEFYKRRKREKVNVLWRLTLIIFPIYLFIIVLINPIKWIITGEWGYGRKFIDNFHSKWVRKLGL